jgi:hypothetical protein
MRSTGERIFLRVVSLVFVLGVFVASASAQTIKHVSAARGTSDFGLTKEHHGGARRPAAGRGTSVPMAAQPGISGALGRDDSRYQVRAVDGGLRAENPQQALTAEFALQGIEVHSGTARWGLALRGYGYGDALRAASPAAPQASANRVEYRRGALTEWYVNGPLGMEQGFKLADRPGRSQGEPLTIVLQLSEDLSTAVDPGGKGVTLTRRDGQAGLRYAGLVAYDATGKELRSWLEARGDDLLVRVEDAEARYPLVIDPFIQIAKVTDGASDGFGLGGIGISSDGGTLVVQGLGSNSQGVVYVFLKPASGWATTSNFTAELSASDGARGDSFGYSVGVSSDGGVVVVGAPFAAVGSNFGQGAAYMFVKPASGWASTTETAKLTASDGAGNDSLGFSVGISSDGGTLLAGAYFADVGSNIAQGAAYVFEKPASGWATTSNFAAKLTASDGTQTAELGFSVGISGDGGTVLVGADGAMVGSNGLQGAAYVFVRPASGWATTANFTAKLTASDGAPDDVFAVRVGVSSDGATVLAGAENATIGSNRGQGAAYLFLKPASGWATGTETAKLTASDGAQGDLFGNSLAISGDASAVVVGVWQATIGANPQQGAAYVFLKPASGWATTATFDAKLTASDGAAFDNLGKSVGVSGDGGTVFAGGAFGPLGLNFQSAVYVFGPQGSGVPAASPSTTNLNFGHQDVKTTSTSQTVTLTNTGSAALQVSGVSASSDFATTTNCIAASPLQPNASCTESVTFTPPVAGPASGTLTFTDNSGNIGGSQQTVSLSGTGMDFAASAAPASQSVLPGRSVKYRITLTPLDGFTGTVKMSYSGGPPGATCRLSASSVMLNAAAAITATVTVPRNARKRTWTVTFTGTSGSLVHSASVKLAVN